MEKNQMLLFEGATEEPPKETYPAMFLARPKKGPILKKVKIESLKGIDELEIELQPPLTILTGPNNSGKSTILQAILLGFDVFRRCLDVSNWTIRTAGKALPELEYLRTNQPKDLWFKQVWKPQRSKEKYIKIGFTFDNDFEFTSRIRYLYGALNIGVEGHSPGASEDILKSIASSAPILLPPSAGPLSHEPVAALPMLHYTLSSGDPATVLRNILLQLQNEPDKEAWAFVQNVLNRYFGMELDRIEFDDRIDREIRAPYASPGYSLDIVSAGSGLNQILQLTAIIAWRKPGIVLLDEPDAHLHSTLQSKLLDFLYFLSKHYGIQIIISTHSRELISQAPLQAIIPVDLTRTKLKPIESLEHLLLEYERQGTVSNVDIALLYQTKKCLFVEGPTDSKLLPKIAERIDNDVFKGKEQVVTFEFGGIENLKLVPKVVELFERMIGARLSWATVRDRDANLPELIEEYTNQATEIGVKNLFVWSSYSIENLLLDPALIAKALSAKYSPNTCSAEEITVLLTEAAKIVEQDVGGSYITKAQVAYRTFGKEHPFDQAAKDAYKFMTSIDTLEKRLKYYPGKKVFGQFVQLLQDRKKLTLRLDDIVGVLDKENIPQDIVNLFNVLTKL